MRKTGHAKRGLSRFSVILFVVIASLAGPSRGQERFWIEFVASKQHYEIRRLRKFAFAYIDREFAFSEIPRCLQGQPYVLTANSDKFSRANPFLTLRTTAPATLYVGYDQRYTSIPDWLQEGFRRVHNLRLSLGSPKTGKVWIDYDLYRRTFSRERIQLGGNLAGNEKSNYSMYTVIVAVGGDDPC